ncbi:hypothetical protein BCV70DRAFT_24055 [Testicularia cyperi]|uniref:Uncharacterized protein n=1 Tax=Testicularia cyperi TaxID=1882483 RepID=A0A317Y126_9BASI|nr:hypothetical protein BCV70DRAFT_24055 [Testicularia cyperi]
MSFFQKAARLLRIGKARYIVGQDLAGNSYVELPSLSGSTDPRHTRRSILWKEKRELGDYDQRSIPVQWIMWLRHTRREAPTIEELAVDRQRILTTQANAAKLALEDQQNRQREQQARLEEHEAAKANAQKLIQTSSASDIPTSTIIDPNTQEQTQNRILSEHQEPGQPLQQERQADHDVWAASRARLAAKGQLDPNEQQKQQPQEQALDPVLEQALQRRAARRAGLEEQDAERQRARQEMLKSPLEAFVPMPKSRR